MEREIYIYISKKRVDISKRGEKKGKERKGNSCSLERGEGKTDV